MGLYLRLKPEWADSKTQKDILIGPFLWAEFTSSSVMGGYIGLNLGLSSEYTSSSFPGSVNISPIGEDGSLTWGTIKYKIWRLQDGSVSSECDLIPTPFNMDDWAGMDRTNRCPGCLADVGQDIIEGHRDGCPVMEGSPPATEPVPDVRNNTCQLCGTEQLDSDGSTPPYCRRCGWSENRWENIEAGLSIPTEGVGESIQQLQRTASFYAIEQTARRRRGEQLWREVQDSSLPARRLTMAERVMLREAARMGQEGED